MLARDDYSDEEDEDAEKPSSQRLRAISGDDLGDSFVLEEEPRSKKGWVDEILERDAENSDSEEDGSSEDSENSEDGSDEEGSEEDNDVPKEGLSIRDWEQSDDENLETDLDGEEEEEEEDDDEVEEQDDDDNADEKDIKAIDSKKEKNILAVETSERRRDSLEGRKNNADKKQPSMRIELPYLIEAPKSFEEFSALLDNCSNSDTILIINRIRASNAIKLAAENRKKMQV